MTAKTGKNKLGLITAMAAAAFTPSELASTPITNPYRSFKFHPSFGAGAPQAMAGTKKSIHNAKRKRSNMNHVSRQLRRKHRRAKK